MAMTTEDLPLPDGDGVKLARHVDGVREICAYNLNGAGYIFQWDIIGPDVTQHTVRREHPYFLSDMGCLEVADEYRLEAVKKLLEAAQ